MLDTVDEENKADLTLGSGPADNTELFDEKKEVIGADQPMEIVLAVLESRVGKSDNAVKSSL